MNIIIKNNLNNDFADTSLSVEKRLVSIGNNLLKVNSELEMHQSELYLVKQGIMVKSNDYYSKAKCEIKENLVDAFQHMEWSFISNNISSFCTSVYRQLEIFTNHCLFDVKRCNENIDFDSKANKFKVNGSHFLNTFSGWYIYDSRKKANRFIDFKNSNDKQEFIEPYYFKTAKKDNKGVLNISLTNKLNLIFGLYINKKITNPKDNQDYHFMNNRYSDLTLQIKDIRDAKEHGIPSKHYEKWETQKYFEAIKLVQEIYQRVKDLKVE